MKPQFLYDEIVIPSMALLAELTNHRVPITEQADIMLMAIAGQESEWRHRRQIGGPARSYWQGELTGGMIMVLAHPATGIAAADVCRSLDIAEPSFGEWKLPKPSTVYEAIAWNDTLACCLARLLLFSDPMPLPAVGHEAAAWEYYIRTWRPGAPHRHTWSKRYQLALDIVGRVK